MRLCANCEIVEPQEIFALTRNEGMKLPRMKYIKVDSDSRSIEQDVHTERRNKPES